MTQESKNLYADVVEKKYLDAAKSVILLLDQLKISRRIYDSDSQRKGITAALTAIYTYLQNQFPDHLLDPLHTAILAFNEADTKGIRHPIFEVDLPHHAPPLGSDELWKRGWASVIAECYFRHEKKNGGDLKGALSKAANAINCNIDSQRAFGEQVSAKQIKQWRENAKTGDKNTNYDALVYSKLLPKDSKEKDHTKPLDYANCLLKNCSPPFGENKKSE